MNCIKCGKEIPDGELFCIECSLLPSKSAAPSAPSKGSARPKSPVEKAARHPLREKNQPVSQRSQKQAAKHPESEPPCKRPVGLAVTMVVFLLISLALGAFIVLNWGKLLEQKASLRVREADVTLREGDMTDLERRLSEAQAKLDAAIAWNEELNGQIDELKKQLNGTQSTMNQTQFDMTSQQQQMQQLVDENTQLSALVEQMEQESASLAKKVTALTATSAAYGVKADFMDKYVVFVNNDGSKYYHKYDCKDFARQSFWAYSRKLAESNGYSACPNCG